MAANPLAGEGEAEVKTETKKPKSGTRVSGYVNSPTPKQCQTCEYFFNNGLCTNKIVMRDSQVPFAERSKFKKIDPVNGCCDLWTE